MQRLIYSLIALVLIASLTGCGEITEPAAEVVRNNTVWVVDEETLKTKYPDNQIPDNQFPGTSPFDFFHETSECERLWLFNEVYTGCLSVYTYDGAKAAGYQACSVCSK